MNEQEREEKKARLRRMVNSMSEEETTEATIRVMKHLGIFKQYDKRDMVLSALAGVLIGVVITVVVVL